MTNSKYVKIWDLLNRYDFEISSDKYRDLKCIICNKIARNVQQGPCGCRYCFQCIAIYLSDGKEFCPGDSEDCKEQILNLKSSVLVDHTANRIISQILIKCPLDNCNSYNELSQMELHIQSHKACPFITMGCKENINNDGIADHLIYKNHLHMDLLADSYYNLEQQINSIKNQSEKQIVNLTNELIKMKIDHNARITELNNYINKIVDNNNNLNTENMTLKSEILIIKEMTRNKQDILLTKPNYDNLQNTNDIIERINILEANKELFESKQKEILDKLSTIAIIEEEVKKLTKTNQDDNKIRLEDKSILFGEISNFIELSLANNCSTINKDLSMEEYINNNNTSRRKKRKMNAQSKPNDESINSIDLDLAMPSAKAESSMQINKSINNFIEPFIITIPNFSKCVQEAKNGNGTQIISEPFYSVDQYRMCLIVYPNGVNDVEGTHLSVAIKIMEGEFDDQLVWPMQFSVKFSMNDQSMDNSVYFKKPSAEINVMFDRQPMGMINIALLHRLIKLKNLFNNTRLYKDDSIVVSICVGKI